MHNEYMTINITLYSIHIFRRMCAEVILRTIIKRVIKLSVRDVFSLIDNEDTGLKRYYLFLQ